MPPAFGKECQQELVRGSIALSFCGKGFYFLSNEEEKVQDY
jgi:hypothetical protein